MIIKLSDFDGDKPPSWGAFTDVVRRYKSRPVEALNAKGIPAYFRDPVLADGLIQQLPDGSLNVVEISPEGEISVIRAL